VAVVSAVAVSSAAAVVSSEDESLSSPQAASTRALAANSTPSFLMRIDFPFLVVVVCCAEIGKHKS
jgi:hypothetical protein